GSTRGPAGRNGRRQTETSMMRSVRARIGTSGGPSSDRGGAEHPASAIPSGTCRMPRRPIRTGGCPSMRLHHPEVLELPGIVAVDVLGEQPGAVLQRRPAAVLTDHRAKVGHADLEIALEV